MDHAPPALGRASLAATCGAADQVLHLLDDRGIAPYLWTDGTRPMNNKTRSTVQGQFLPDRFDFESNASIPHKAAEAWDAAPAIRSP
ncbi:MAG: hypothetical protein KJ000_29110 [Pirellulaceae bacterium]|nr:hypothetical protein [Pirellulaceae bacterium]